MAAKKRTLNELRQTKDTVYTPPVSHENVTPNLDNGILKTTVLPEFNCNNCKHYQKAPRKMFDMGGTHTYAYECNNVTHPLEDCVMRGFQSHSEQPGLKQTLNK